MQGFKDALLKYCNQVSYRENKAFNEMLEREEGTFSNPQRDKGQHWDGDREEKDGEAKFQRCFTQHKLRLVSLMHQALTPTGAHSHLCVCRSLNTAPKKTNARLAAPDPLCPLRSAQHPPSKFVYICGVTLQVTSKTPTQRTLLHYISLSKAVHKFSQLLVV